MIIQTKGSGPTVRAICKALGYRKRSLLMLSTSTVQLGTGWSGGQRDRFYTFHLGTGRLEALAGNPESAWALSKVETPEYQTREGSIALSQSEGYKAGWIRLLVTEAQQAQILAEAQAEQQAQQEGGAQ